MDIDINKEVMDLYNDPNYQELNEYYGKTTIFNILGIERNENRHSSFLRWMLDNRSSHGLGDAPMKKFFRLYASQMSADEDKNLKVLLMSGDYHIDISELVTEKSITKTSNDSKGRIDIWGRMVLRNNDGDIERKVVLIVENKIYSGEGKNQTKDYHSFFEKNHEKDEVAIEVFLTPKKAKRPEDELHFKHITYPDLLNKVILPISKMTMPMESTQIVVDYIRVLGKPSKSDNQKDYSILATSDDECDRLKKIYTDHKDIYRRILYAGNNIESKDVEEDNIMLLQALWNSNIDLFKAILNQIDSNEIKELHVNRESIIKESNRDNTRYFVGLNKGKWLNTNNKPASKAETSFLIFKAYCLKADKELTVEDLRNEFGINLNKYYEGRFLNYLFYDFDKEVIIDVPSHPAYGSEIKPNSHSWDFYWDDNHKLPNVRGNVRSLKMWRRNDFDRLIEKARSLNIIVESVE